MCRGNRAPISGKVAMIQEGNYQRARAPQIEKVFQGDSFLHLLGLRDCHQLLGDFLSINMLSARLNESVNDSNQPTIAFSMLKKELFNPNSGFKSLQRRLRGQYKPIM